MLTVEDQIRWTSDELSEYVVPSALKSMTPILEVSYIALAGCRYIL